MDSGEESDIEHEIMYLGEELRLVWNDVVDFVCQIDISLYL